MTAPGPNPYLRTKILTASPQELRLMLFDGALKFAKLARQTLEAEQTGGKTDYEKLYDNVSRTQKIVLELSTSMKTDVAPEIVEKLNALYTYIYRLLMDANMNRDREALDEAIKLLGYERETWVMLMDKTAAEQANQPGTAATSQQTALSAYTKSA